MSSWGARINVHDQLWWIRAFAAAHQNAVGIGAAEGKADLPIARYGAGHVNFDPGSRGGCARAIDQVTKGGSRVESHRRFAPAVISHTFNIQANGGICLHKQPKRGVGDGATYALGVEAEQGVDLRCGIGADLGGKSQIVVGSVA